MSQMNRLALVIEEQCGVCQETKCEDCRLRLDIGDKIVYVRGKTHEIIGSEKKSNLAKLGGFILSCMKVCVMLMMLLSSTVCFADNIIVKNAQRELGRGEFLFDNVGSDVKRYLNGEEHLPWCAGFVSYVLRESGIKIQYTLRARDFLKLGKTIKDPRAGDLIVFSRGSGCGHVGIIERVDKNKIYTIEGNTGNVPSKVKRLSYNRKYIKNWLAFIRIK